jgi:putative two-component system response regulator
MSGYDPEQIAAIKTPEAGAAVLVVDDDASIRRLIARILARANYLCTEAPDAATAIQLATEHEFELVTLDINMPGGSGLGLMRQLRDRHPDIALLMVTGVDDPKTAATASDLGASGYVVKPFVANEILIATCNSLRRRHLEIENRAHRQELERVVSERTADLRSTVERLSQTEEALRLSQEEAITRLAFAAEFRDPTTGEHISRMSKTCELIAQRTGLGDERAELIRIASPMHDIGKIGVPDEVLRNPGKLTDAEMDQMKKHPIIGSEILAGSDSELVRLGGLIALTHHERWDGTGYPHSLARNEIPIEGRIVAIADVFDALTSERPYKRAFDIDESVSMMLEQRGRHFDPDLLDVFMTLTDEVAALDPLPV